MTQKELLYPVGKTVDEKRVVAGAYRFRETHGLPLDIIADYLLGENTVIAWDFFFAEAVAAGRQPSRVAHDVIAVCVDIYKMPQAHAEALVERLIKAMEKSDVT